LAVYAEGEPSEETLEQIEQGISNNSFQPVRSLSGAFPALDDEVNSAYSQSYSLVDYLLQTYGQEKLQTLILELASAEGYVAAESVPTAIPLGLAQSVATPPSSESSMATPSDRPVEEGQSSGICGLGVVPVITLVGFCIPIFRKRRLV
jgi:hypothetical protein